MQKCAKGVLVLAFSCPLSMGVYGFGQSVMLADSSPATTRADSSAISPKPRSGGSQWFGMGAKVSMLVRIPVHVGR